ncbi:hypothetical protein LZC95_06965 [Pendulispora brunnea]|uniref:Lipoprotein n=1 Tax=Pendulispora brunnea TaxID=2905690 RepID=A0ABZ2KGY2_9BACT
MLRRLMGAAAVTLCACYSGGGNGSDPPSNQLYFPVGLAVSTGGNVLYAVNSDFDLQWSGGTLQSYDLFKLRHDIGVMLNWDPGPDQRNFPGLPYVEDHKPAFFCKPDGTFPGGPEVDQNNNRIPVGRICAPPMHSEAYFHDSVTIGAFATDLQLSRGTLDGSPTGGRRLFMPMRSDASLTWVDIAADDPAIAPPDLAPGDSSFPPFALRCNGGATGHGARCDAGHSAGNNPNELGNNRKITMPGEPFGMAQTEDGTAIVVTHQNDTRTSLFGTGLHPVGTGDGCPLPVPVANPQNPTAPALQFVAENITIGGNGIASIPHDVDAYAGNCDKMPRPAFWQTSRFLPRLDRVRYYADDGQSGWDPTSKIPPSAPQYRPYLQGEATVSIFTNPSGIDSRGIAIDNTQRIACKAQPGADKTKCAQLPARAFIANRQPATVLIGQVGAVTTEGGYNPDDISIYANIPLTVGASRVYLAPIVDRQGNYALRLFIVCFDSATIFVYDPQTEQIENVIRVGTGPFAMAFDPFDINDVALRKPVPVDDRQKDPIFAASPLRRYSFAYVASFTNSFVQVIDLDNSRPKAPNGQPLNATFETVVYTLGTPTAPKGSN